MQLSHGRREMMNRNRNQTLTPLTVQRLALLATAILLIGLALTVKPVRVARAATMVQAFNITGGTPTAIDNDYIRIKNAIVGAMAGDTINLQGTFNWTEANAAASWALGNDGMAGTLDDYSILVPANLNSVTLTAASLGDATIQGPGDLAAIDLEGVLFFDGSGDNQGWTISNIRFVDFDLSIGFFNGAGGTDAYNNTKIINNYIKIAKDLNATVAPADSFQNIGIHFSFGANQMISGNTIEFDGDGVSDGANFSSQVGMQSNTNGNAYDGLQITNNILRVLNAQSANPQVILGIWENGHAHTSNITVSGNQFINLAMANNPATNLQRAFRVTSHSSATTTVTYQNNNVQGANIGFQWLAAADFSGNQPVQLISNNIFNNDTGVLIQSNGSATLSFNRIHQNTMFGLNNSTTNAINAENNWWGCNFGPGVGGAGCATTPNGLSIMAGGSVDFNPWLVLRLTAVPSTISVGGTSTLTADLTFNSDNVDTHLMGTVPDGIPVQFMGNAFGTVAPPNTTTTSGKATSIYTGTMPGTGNVSTLVDAQTVTTPITVLAPATITSAGATLVTESCSTPVNGALDPGETVTVSFCVQNTGGVNTTNLVGTLQATGGVTSPSGPQTYGVVVAGGPAVCRNFTFTASGTCGGTVTASIQFQDGAQNLGTVTYTFTLGVMGVCCSPPATCTITCPANITKSNDPNQCGAVVTYPAPTTTGTCGTVTCAPASGSFFPVGTTTVTCTASAGPSCTFTVKVNDTQPPTITCPPNKTTKTVNPNDPCVPVNFTTTASDNCPGVTVLCNPPSGSCFPVGTITVTCTATDMSGNTATCSFTVSVFNVCLQDDSNPNTVFLGNTVTGAYRFCCNGTTFTGVAQVTKRGSVITFTHNAPDRRVQATDDEGVFKGTASLQSPPGTIRCTIADKDTRNNSCVCP